jgi:hypothetical protein
MQAHAGTEGKPLNFMNFKVAIRSVGSIFKTAVAEAALCRNASRFVETWLVPLARI